NGDRGGHDEAGDHAGGERHRDGGSQGELHRRGSNGERHSGREFKRDEREQCEHRSRGELHGELQRERRQRERGGAGGENGDGGGHDEAADHAGGQCQRDGGSQRELHRRRGDSERHTGWEFEREQREHSEHRRSGQLHGELQRERRQREHGDSNPYGAGGGYAAAVN
ncbi:MAG: hypothetical protein NZ847_07150, partial [Acidobacteria bacterium]|nr:hypothetical protein [Acidobacteriota bacterium]